MNTQTIPWSDYSHEVFNSTYFWPILIGIVLLIILWQQIRKNRQTIDLFKNESGKVAVIQNALIDLIKKICEEVVPESKPSLSLCAKKDKLNMKIKIKIYPNQHIEKVSSTLQQELYHTLKDTLGIENIGAINILIIGFHKEDSKKNNSITSELD